jgi:hypothetical protein
VLFVEYQALESFEVAFQLLFFMFCLFVLGEPWRLVLRRFVGLFRSLDLLQTLVLNVYLGGFLLYVIAIVPLHLFSATILYTITIVSAIVVFSFHWRKIITTIQKLSLHTRFSFSNNRSSYELIIVASMFLLGLFIQTSPFNHLLFGSVRDTAIHSLFTQVLIENKQVPMTEQPYSGAGIVYPQGHTAIIAFSTFILNYSPPQAVFYVTVLFNALTILGAYFLGKMLSGKGHLGLNLAFIFAFVASWPKYITWGSNALVIGFPLYFICLSFLLYLAKVRFKTGEIFAIGILFGYLSVLHLELYQTLIASLLVLWLYVLLKKEKGRWIGLRNLIVVFCLSLLVLSPFLYRALAFYSYPFHNVGLPADVEIPTVEPSFSLVLNGTMWILSNLASNTLLVIFSLFLLFASVLIIGNILRKKGSVPNGELCVTGIASFLGQLLILGLAAVFLSVPIFYPLQLLLYIPLCFSIAIFSTILYRFFSSYFSKILAKTNVPKLEAKKLLISALSLMLLVGIYSPFLYQGIVLDAGGLTGSYAVFAVTTQQDLQLILWIKGNLTKNATILVNTYQSGTLIPSIANRRVVFISDALSNSVSYQKIVASLEKNSINATIMNLMQHFNITNVYVGSGVSIWDDREHQWDPKLFLGNPNFDLVTNFGNAYLFQFNYANPNIVFLDNFEHAHWYDYAWQTYDYGNGLSNVTIATNAGCSSGKCLKITAAVIPKPWEWMCARCVSREIYVQNNSDVTLSFYLNATEGFHGKDTFALFVSNVYRNQSMIIATPNSAYENYTHTIPLNSSEGYFEFNGSNSLSARWHQMFNSSLPSTFILEFVNLDFDGIPNIAYIGNIQITSTPLG